jgi:two-component system cell cycle sensor histidine kinase/response regulator CckA
MATPASPSQPARSIEAMRLALSQLPSDASLDHVFRHVCELSANMLSVERVGVWLFIDNRTVLRCANLFERSTGEHSSGTLLRVADFPTYFASLTIFKAVPAEVAITDAWTAELAASYLRPLGITSMLDVGLFVNEKLVGVICDEHVGPSRVWSEDARQCGVAVADFLSARIQAAEVRELRATFMMQGDRMAALEKNAALEQLAAGVVRHFRSLLDVFQGHGERISINPDVPLPARRQAAEIMAAAERGAVLAGELLQFSRQEGGPPQVLDLGNEVANVLPTLQVSTGPGYRLRYTPVAGLGHVLIERSRFSQLLSHLVSNACEAMPNGGPVEINLTNAKRIGDSNHSSLFVLLEVTDHSEGLDEAALRRVMEPYSTARSTGSGLGLAIVRQVVEEAGGVISIESAPNRGTTFKVFFPRIGAGEKPSDPAGMALANH